jgi:IclR family transcriptional regulator, KDG regulon repressor
VKKQINSKPYKVHSLERGLDLIELLAKNPQEISLSELSRTAGFSQSTAHRILSALKARGYVRQNSENSKYKLSLKLFELGNMTGRHLNLKEESLHLLKRLATQTMETAYLIIKDEDMALCLERIDGNPAIRILTLEIGRRQPLHLGAAPKVLLAYLGEKEIDRIIQAVGLEAWTAYTTTNPIQLKQELKQIREQGYAVSVDDVTVGVAAVGVPVFDFKDEVICSISIGGMSNNFKDDRLPMIINAVKTAAKELSVSLGKRQKKQ